MSSILANSAKRKQDDAKVNEGGGKRQTSETSATTDYSPKSQSKVEELKTVTPEEIAALEGRDVRFTVGDQGIDFLAEDFLLTFSLPNFYFHAATTYDLLRMKGVPLGKRDFLGQMRTKG